MALERSDLVPVERKDTVSEFRDRNDQCVVSVRRQVLDGVLDQRHQRRQLVGGVPLAMLEQCDDALAEQQRITRHGRCPVVESNGPG